MAKTYSLLALQILSILCTTAHVSHKCVDHRPVIAAVGSPVTNRIRFVSSLVAPSHNATPSCTFESSSAASALPRSRSCNPSNDTTDRRTLIRMVSRAHTCALLHGDSGDLRSRARNTTGHTIVTFASLHDVTSVTERLCRNGCAGDAVRDTSTRGHGDPRTVPFSVFLSFSHTLFRPL